MPELNTRRVVWALAGLAFAASVFLFGWSPSAVARREREAARTAPEAQEVASPLRATRAPRVRIGQVERAEALGIVRVSGLLAPSRRVTLSAEEQGAIAVVAVEEHSRVDAGAVLVQLDDTALRASVARADAALVRARAAHELATLELERQKNLSARQVSSAAELDRARSEERAAFATLGEARASRTEARDRLGKTTIRAPFAGVVDWLDLEPGTFVQRGERVSELIDIASIEIEVGVSDREVVELREGNRVELEVDVFPGERFQGTIARIGRAADAESQTYPVEIEIPNPGERLLPGMVARVHLTLGSGASAIRIPRRAVLHEFELDYVYVVEEDDVGWVARRRRVAVRRVPFRPELVEVVDGLEPGERIAITAVEALRDGLEIQPESS